MPSGKQNQDTCVSSQLSSGGELLPTGSRQGCPLASAGQAEPGSWPGLRAGGKEWSGPTGPSLPAHPCPPISRLGQELQLAVETGGF